MKGYITQCRPKVFEIHGVIRKFLYETPINVQDKIYLDGVFLPKQKAFSQENISKMRLVDDGSFQQVPQVDDFVLAELQHKFGHNTRWDDQLDTVWEKVVEEERVDVEEDVAQAEQRMKKRMDAPSSKVAPPQQCSASTFIAPKATGVMANVSKRATSKKQPEKPMSTTQRRRTLSETESKDDRYLIFRKQKVALPSNETSMPQAKKVKQTQQAPSPSTTQPPSSKLEMEGAQRSKGPEGEQSST